MENNQTQTVVPFYPKIPRKNLEWRYELLNKCTNDLTYRLKVKELFHRDVLFAFNAFFFTLDVRKRPLQHQPFCTYDYQDEAITTLADSIMNGTAEFPKDLAIEKSRDMGVSWLVILAYLWFWLKPDLHADFLLGSRIEDYVDKKGDMRTLIEKARYALYKLPEWLRPVGFYSKKHDNFMKLINPETGSTITGESNNPNFSTGGRYMSTFFDEFAKWESSDKSAWTAAGDATPCRVAVSTPFGAGGQYYDVVTGGKTKVITFHWSKHPDKNKGLYCVWPQPDYTDEPVLRSPWYDRQCERRSATEIAQELDIDYIGAGNPVFTGKAARQIGRLLKKKKNPLGYFAFDYVGLKMLPRNTMAEYEDLFVLYKAPSEAHSYIVAADVAEGKVEGDYSIVKVLNRETLSIDATFAGHVDEVQLAKAIKMVCEFFSFPDLEEPWWAVEANGPGLATFDLCAEIYDIPNAFMMPTYDSVKESISHRKGWWTSTNSRRKIIGGIKNWLIEREGWADPRCLRELTTFVLSGNGKAQAKDGCYDDEVMTFGIALQVHMIAPYEEPEKYDSETQEDYIARIFDLKKHKIDNEPTMEERCILTAIKNRQDSLNELIALSDIKAQGGLPWAEALTR